MFLVFCQIKSICYFSGKNLLFFAILLPINFDPSFAIRKFVPWDQFYGLSKDPLQLAMLNPLADLYILQTGELIFYHHLGAKNPIFNILY